MSCRLLISLINCSFFKNFTTKKRNCMYFTTFKAKVFKIWSQNLSSFIPFRNNIQVFSNFTVIILICFNISFLLLSIPSKESQLYSLSKLILLLSFQSLLLISFFLFHDSFNLMISDSPLLNLFVFKDIFSSDFKVNWLSVLTFNYLIFASSILNIKAII